MGRMKQFLTLFAVVAGVVTASAQMVVRGTVRDDVGEPMAESEVYVDGYPGTSVLTNEQGNYELTVQANQAPNGKFKIVSTTIGLPDITREVTYQEGGSLDDVSFAMVDPSSAPVKGSGSQVAGTTTPDAGTNGVSKIDTGNQVVVIKAQRGYGSVAEEIQTSSVALVTSKDFNKGPATSPEQLIAGKTPGVSITDGGGRPGGEQNIRIRGMVSLGGSNNPLIVIDGVPMETGVGGVGNVLSTINPNDIETFSVLKDASSAAIYGSRGSAGVIIITTKKGGKKWKFNYSGKTSLSDPYKTLDVLSGDEYRALAAIKQAAGQSIEPMGTANTDWQDQIYRKALSFDNSFSASGTIAKVLPVRASVGYTDTDGVLIGDNLKRITGSISLTPKLFDKHLALEINAKGANIKSDFANTDAIGAAAASDPTQEIYDATSPNGYFSWESDQATDNPLAMLKYFDHTGEVNRLTTNIKADYKLHFFPDLVLTANAGYDYMTGKTDNYNDKLMRGNKLLLNTYYNAEDHGDEMNFVKLLDLYATYTKTIGSHDVSLLAGHSHQRRDWRKTSDWYSFKLATTDPLYHQYRTERNRSVLKSYFTRLNYAFDKKYMIEASLRYDGSSKLNPDDRWKLFPAVSAAWKIDREKFMQDVKWLTDLKLRAGWGKTGNQGGIGNYDYYPTYESGQASAQYELDNQYFITYRPNVYNDILTWETTETIGLGLDFGIFNKRITGSVDYYTKKTTDLLLKASLAAGSLNTEVMSNVGSMENKGVDVSLNVKLVDNDNLTWTLGANANYNDSRVTALNGFVNHIDAGGSPGIGTGGGVKTHMVGMVPGSFYLYEQVYDANGRPIEGLYTDLNGDGQSTADDYKAEHFENPNWTFGFNTAIYYKNWDLSASARAALNNYVYNANAAGKTAYDGMSSKGFNTNLYSEYAKYNFQGTQAYSDVWVEDASYFKLDNITLGYKFPESWIPNIGFRVYGSVQNVLTITDYSGLDPEVWGGVDNSIYPRPRTYLFGVSIDFN